MQFLSCFRAQLIRNCIWRKREREDRGDRDEMSDSDDNNERSEDYCVHVQWPVVYTYEG